MQDKIICDYCGTIYPAASHKCPICGNVADSGGEEPAPAAPAQEKARARKTGPMPATDFFKDDFAADEAASAQEAEGIVSPEQPQTEAAAAPVTPAAKAAPAPQAAKPAKAASKAEKPRKKRAVTKGAVITLVILLLAVLGMGVFIWSKFQQEFDPSDLLVGQVTAPTQIKGGELPCTGIQMSNTQISLTEADSSVLLDVKLSPSNTTDELTFISEDPAIAEVNADGLVTAVAPGTVRITVICGALESSCTVHCDFEDPNATTDPSETEETEESTGEVTMSHTDVTLFEEGESFTISIDGYSNVQFEWVSEDEEVATVSNGKVTAVGEGKTVIHAVLEEEELDLECIVRCNFE